MKTHSYKTKIQWTGNNGEGTQDYHSYSRNFTIDADSKSRNIKGSADPNFKGEIARYNPEDLLLASLTSCHMLWYLHLCSENGITVLSYIDESSAEMEETENGSGKFKSATLNPIVTITDKNLIEKAERLHAKAHDMCFIANSCNFKIEHKSTIVIDA